jgi:hypothetical protein
VLFGEAACLAPFGTAPFGEGCFCVAGSGDVGAAGTLCPIDTEMPNSRHCPLMGANDRWKFTWIGTEGKKPAMCIRPLMRGASAGGAVGQFARVGASVVDELDERLGCDLVGIDDDHLRRPRDQGRRDEVLLDVVAEAGIERWCNGVMRRA